jgi:hypothetical protein
VETSKHAATQGRARWPWLIGLALALPLLELGHVCLIHIKMRKASQAGRAASRSISATEIPLTTFTRDGLAGDPINVELQGTSSQVGAAFALAGWYRADEITLLTSLRISLDSLFRRAYSTAPVSNLYLYGRKEDLAFERPGTNVRQRDHIRLWQMNQNTQDSRPRWIGSATHDIKVELARTNHLPTHGIAPDVDSERDLVVSALTQTGYVVNETTRPGFGQETQRVNGGGDPYFTDGQIAVLTLANVWTMPFADQVRGQAAAGLLKRLSGTIMKTLPGHERASRERARVAAANEKQASGTSPV